MPDNQLTLGEQLSMVALGPLCEKRLFRKGLYVRLGPFCFQVTPWMLQQGAVIGRALRSRVGRLLAIMTSAGREETVRSKFLEDIRKAIERCENAPQSFIQLAGGFFDPTSDAAQMLKPTHGPTSLEAFRRLNSQRVRLGGVLPMVDDFLVAGLVFGERFPEETERIWRSNYEQLPETQKLEVARASGLNITEQSQRLSLEEEQERLIGELSNWLKQYHPDTVANLG